MDGKYLGISDVRVNGTSIGVGNAAYGPTSYEGYASDFHVFSSSDGYAILFDRWMIENTSELPWGHTTWDGKDGTISAINPDDLKAVNNLEVDFFVTGEQGKLPEEPVLSYDYTWYPNNTIVTVEGDTVTVDYETQHASPGNLIILSECVQWFDELEDITAEFVENPQSDLAFGQTISKTDLGKVGYLFVCNRVTDCQPIADNGIYLARYNHSGVTWAAYRAGLDAMVEALEEAPAE